MTQKKRSKKSLEKKDWAQNIAKQKTSNPDRVDWTLCADAVDDLYAWIHELCIENHKLKQVINRTISKIEKDNKNTKDILKSLGPKFNIIDSRKEE